MGLPKITTNDPAKIAAINFAYSRTPAIVDVLIVFSEGEWSHESFVATNVDDFRYLAAWLTAAAHLGKRGRSNYVAFDALVTFIVMHMDKILGIPWQEVPTKKLPKPMPPTPP